jgi:hypothetical protein
LGRAILSHPLESPSSWPRPPRGFGRLKAFLLALLAAAYPIFKNDRVRAFQAKSAARVARLEDRADKKERQGSALLVEASRISSFIPFGQPILVGHHSEKRHRRDLDRIHRKTGQGFALQEQAARLRDRAVSDEENRSIFSDDPEASEKLEAKIARLKERQRLMVEVNKRLRKGDPLQDLGFSIEAEAELKKGDFLKRIGYPDYKIKNNGANVRRLELRLKHVVKQETEALPEDQIIHGIRIVENGDENRLQVFFPGRPSEEVRHTLKQSGFRWSPSNGCWHYADPRIMPRQQPQPLADKGLPAPQSA